MMRTRLASSRRVGFSPKALTSVVMFFLASRPGHGQDGWLARVLQEPEDLLHSTIGTTHQACLMALGAI